MNELSIDKDAIDDNRCVNIEAKSPSQEEFKERCPLVTVVVPAYNVEKTVSATIESLLVQDYPRFEVLCVDDGSTDGTADILNAFAVKDSRVRVIHKKNGGYGSAVNTGLDEAKGEWIGILESDDTCHPGMLSCLVKLGEAKSADMVKADWNLWWHDSGDCRPAGKINYKWCGHHLSCKERLRLCKVPPAIWSAIYRKSFLEKNVIRCLETPGAAFQDTSFNIKAVLSCEKLVVTRDSFVNYRQDNPLSSVRSKTQAESLLFEYAELSDFLKIHPSVAAWAADTVRGIEARGYLWNLKRLAPEQRAAFLDAVRKRLPDHKLFAHPEKVLRKIASQVARRQRRQRRWISLHWNSNRIELIIRGKTVFYKSFGRQ